MKISHLLIFRYIYMVFKEAICDVEIYMHACNRKMSSKNSVIAKVRCHCTDKKEA